MLSQKGIATRFFIERILDLPPGERLVMNAQFWIRRYLVAFLAAFAVIGFAQFLKGHTLRYSITQAIIWGIITAGVYISAAIYRFRKGQHCALCDIPGSVPFKDSSAPQP